MADGAPSSRRITTSGRPVHGGLKPAELRALGLRPEDVLDFSASISPIGPPSGVWEALKGVDLGAYPDPQCLLLREAISLHFLESTARRVSTDCILVGNGSTEIIHLLARAYLSPPQSGTKNNAFLFTPTYGEYFSACGIAGAATSCCDAKERPGFLWDLDEAAQRIIRERPSLVFLCNPNNPTGVFLKREEARLVAEATSSV